ncbi:MAG: PEGA domain-containing protein [Methanomicrobiales archaeon]|nr:PEGA domain-containing protein [Methanomicrobiales archaeon]
MNNNKILILTILTLNLLLIGAASASVSYSDSAAAPGLDTVKSSGNSYAILAGVSTYMDPSIDKLEGVKYDTPHMRDMLIDDCGFSSSRITTLQDSQATKSAIRSALLQMSSRVGLDDTVVFYFSGHGHVYPAGYGTSYIKPYDASTVYIDYDISTSELKSWLDGIPCRNVLVIIDACESGAMIKGGPKALVATSQAKAWTGENSNTDQFSQNFLGTFESPNIVGQSPTEQGKAISGNQYVVLVACRSDEISWANYYSGSWFTTYFVEGIGSSSADTNYDSWVSAEEAFHYASPRTTLKHDDQHPMIYDGNQLNDLKMHYYGSSTLGEISVSSTPYGARIYLDGADTGYNTPATLTELSVGSHSLILKKSGYADYTTSATVTAGQMASVSATLTPQQTTGSLKVTTTPSGATIVLDGINKGTTPATLTGISAGSHAIILKKSGYADYTTSATVTAGQTASVSATLTPQQTTGSLSVTSTPTGATIVLDGINKGTTPATFTGVSTGSHALVLKKSGYADYSASVTVTAGQTASVTATLSTQQTTGSLSVSSTPSGATIVLDGINKGTTPTTLNGITAGSHAIILKKSGYADYSASVTVTAGQTASISATLGGQQATGSISVSSTPPGATILLDGINKGTTPTTLNGISAGTHTIVLKKSGYPDYLANIIINAGQTASISVSLVVQQPTGSISVSSTPPGAMILLDGINKGTTPATLNGISAGSHAIVLKKSGYPDYSASITVIAGQTASISATLAVQTLTGSISVSSTPPGATILLDGINKGTTPTTLTGLSAGTHTIVLKKSGYPDYSASIIINAGQTASASFNFGMNPLKDPVIGVWRYSGSTFDDRYHLYADGTYVESFYSYTRLTTSTFSGTWTANGGNSYALHQSDGTAFTMIYNPVQNTLYDTRYSSLLLTPYLGDVMKGVVLPGARQPVNGVSESETGYFLLAQNDKAQAITVA